MGISLPLDRMTTAEKLQAMEEIWEDLCRSAKDLPSPSWHEEVLRKRQRSAKEGSADYVDWAQAKERIRDSLK